MDNKIFDEISDRESYLETSQKAIKLLLNPQRIDEADDLLQKATEQLDRWLAEIPNPTDKKTIALKFSDFNQLTVDRHIQTASQLQDDRAMQTQHTIALETNDPVVPQFCSPSDHSNDDRDRPAQRHRADD